MLLTQDTALITGVGSPIGRAFAKAIAREGGRLVGTDINIKQGQTAIRDVTADGELHLSSWQISPASRLPNKYSTLRLHNLARYRSLSTARAPITLAGRSRSRRSRT